MEPPSTETPAAATNTRSLPLVIGLDVGGTNTDAVLFNSQRVLRSVKVSNHLGVQHAVHLLNVKNETIEAVFVGTTAFVNSLLEQRNLDQVAVVRLCGPSPRSLPPCCDFASLPVCAGTWFATGGLKFDGKPDCELDENELKRIALEIAESSRAQHVVISGTFSPSDASQERQAAQILRQFLPETVQITLSSQLGQLGLLARENAAVLNACLRTTAQRVASSIRNDLYQAGIEKSTQLYFTCNDGSVMSFAQASKTPLRCVQCGPTNSLRGAAYFSRENNSNDGNDMDCIVLDVGGTSTDAGCLVRGIYPRDSNAEAYIIGTIRCNLKMTDVVSIALGGGSIIRERNGRIQIGPDSVGAELTTEALCFGGTVFTATCLAVAMGATMSWPSDSTTEMQVPCCNFNPPSFITHAWDCMQERFYNLVESTRSDSKPVKVLLVGGGAGLVDAKRLSMSLGGCSVVRPKDAHVANACGSALAQNVGEADIIADLAINNREAVLSKLKAKACTSAGPDAHVIECEEVPLAYLPGKMTRIFVRAVAPLDLSKQSVQEWEDSLGDEDIAATPHDHDSLDETPTASRQEEPQPLIPTPMNIKNGMWSISEYDAHCLAIGCGILGCGGGGSTYHGRLQLLRALRQGQSIHVVPVESVPMDAIVAPCGFMGAPSVNLETIGGADQVVAAVRCALNRHSVNDGIECFITSSEIGGCNGIIPLLVGGLMGLKIVDADLMGRAFPELQMTTASIYGLPQTPMCVSDSFGRCVTLEESSSSLVIPADKDDFAERVLRPVCVQFGCYAGFADPLLTGSEIRRVGVVASLSRARHIGDCVLRSSHASEAIDRLLEREGGKCIFRGMISDIKRETTAGFAVGMVTITDAEDKTCRMRIQFQNEFLIAKRVIDETGYDSIVEACVPDIISILDVDTAHPIATEEIRFGFRVVVVVLPVSELLRTERALRVVGPQAFGLEDTYESNLYTDPCSS